MYIPLLQSLSTSNSVASSANPPRSASSSSSTDPTSGLNTMFLQLLTAQLKAQSPLDPLDPNQFVAQLAQLQSLNALTQIDQLMQLLVTGTVGSPTSNNTAQANATHLISNPSTTVSPISR